MVADYPGTKWTRQVLTLIELLEGRIAVVLVTDGECALHHARQRVGLIADFGQVIDVLDIAECFTLDLCLLTELRDYLAEMPLMIFRPNITVQIGAVIVNRC